MIREADVENGTDDVETGEVMRMHGYGIDTDQVDCASYDTKEKELHGDYLDMKDYL